MSSANMMSGLLNASGLKERLQEIGGKMKSLPSGFPRAESHWTKDSSGNEEFAVQFDRLAKEVSVEDLPDFGNSDAGEENTSENSTTFADVETKTEVKAGAKAEDVLADTAVEFEEGADAAMGFEEGADTADVSEPMDDADAEAAAEENETRHDEIRNSFRQLLQLPQRLSDRWNFKCSSRLLMSRAVVLSQFKPEGTGRLTLLTMLGWCRRTCTQKGTAYRLPASTAEWRSNPFRPSAGIMEAICSNGLSR